MSHAPQARVPAHQAFAKAALKTAAEAVRQGAGDGGG